MQRRSSDDALRCDVREGNKSKRATIVLGDTVDRFDTLVLHEILAATREARRLSWTQVAREIGVSGTTISQLMHRGAQELDGIRSMIRWLGRSAMPTIDDMVDPITETINSLGARQRTPTPETAQALDYLVRVSHSQGRFDAKALYAALNTQRLERKMSWNQVSVEVGLSTSILTHTSKGGRIEVNRMLAMVAWLGYPSTAIDFTYIPN